MAEGSLTTTMPGSPGAPPVPTPTSLPASISQPLNPAYGADAAYLQHMGAMNLGLETTLSGDKETLGTLEGNYAYQRQLMAKREGEGYERYGLRNFGLANSGFFQIGRERLAGGYSLAQARAAETAQQGYNKLGAKVQEQYQGGSIKGAEEGLAAKGRLETKALKTPDIAPQASIAGATGAAAGTAGQGGVQGYPKATAYVNTLFPNPGEQVAFSKMSPEQKKAWEAAHRAKGGPVKGGKPYIVGEEGPEIMVPKTNGKVIPNRTHKNAQNIRRRAIERIGRWHG